MSELEASVQRAVGDLPVVAVWLFGSTAVDEAPLRLKARISSEGRVLLSRDEPARIAWTSRVFREHADFALLQDELDGQMLGDHAAGRR